MTEILLGQLQDLFRIGMIVALVATTLRTSAVSGTLMPLAVGVVFVAILIPVAMQGGFDATRVGIGIVANLIILAVILGLWTAFRRLKG